MTQFGRLAICSAATAVFGAFASGAAAQTLTHRYSFNDNGGINGVTATDSVGTADGFLVNNNGAASISGGAINFGNSGTSNVVAQNNYVDLPNNLITDTNNFTIEGFAGFGGGNNWQRLFDFGTGSAGEIQPTDTTTTGYNGTNYILVSPQSGNGGAFYGETRNNGNSDIVLAPQGRNFNNIINPLAIQHQFVLSKAGSTLSLYEDGALIDQRTNAANVPSSADLLNVWLGRSNYAGDPFFNGSIYDFRVYDGALSSVTTALDATLGPDVLPAAVTPNSFIGTASGADFNDPNQWSLNRIPDGLQGDLASIDNGGMATVTVTSSPNAQIKLTNGTLSISGAGVVFDPIGGIDLAPGSVAGASANLSVTGGAILSTPALFVDSGATSGGTSAKTITLDNGTLQALGSLSVSSSVPGALSVVLGVGGGTFDTNGYNITLGAPISGSGGLTKINGGALYLNSANSFTGPTTVNGGLLSFVTGGLASTSSITLSGATLQYAAGNTDDVSTRNLTIAGPGGTIDTNGNNVTFAGPINGNSVFTKAGAGALTLAAGATPSNFFIRQGAIIVDSGGSLVTTGGGNQYASVGQLPGDNGTLIVQGTGNVAVHGDFNISDVSPSNGTFIIRSTPGGSPTVAATTLYVGKGGSSVGAVAMSAGTFSNTGGGGDWRIGGGNGGGDAQAVGTFDLSGGSLTVGNNFQIGAFGTGQLNVTGGVAATPSGFTGVGRFGGSNGYLNVSGTGAFNQSGGTFAIIGEQGTGTVNVFNGGTFTTTTTNAAVGLRLGHNGGTGFLNLAAGGTVNAPAVSVGTGAATVAFNGGTLAANAPSTAFMQGLTHAYVYSAGGTIDTGANDITIAQPLLAASGNGVTSVPVGAAGAGYITAPIVQITPAAGDTTGAGAAGVAAIDSTGKVTSITITSPGNGYTAAPTVKLIGGMAATPASAGAAAIGDNTLVSGGITKLGTGNLTLGGANTYNGATTITAGTLTVGAGGSLSAATPVVNNAAFVVNNTTPTGTVNGVGNTTVAAGSTLTTSHVIQNALNINGTVAVRPTATPDSPAGTSVLSTLNIAGAAGAWTGKLDLGNNGLVINYPAGSSPIATVGDQLRSGYNGGGTAAWTGNGITSTNAANSSLSSAIGYGEASEVYKISGNQTASFLGQTVTPNSLLLRYTTFGDANLDGKVDFSDFIVLSNHFGISTNQGWAVGDFNYDGMVNFSDFILLSNHFGVLTPAQAVAVQSFGSKVEASVPEPASASLLLLAAGGLLARRRRA